MIRKLLIGLASATVLLAPAHAWWNDAWTTRARVVLDTTDKGLALPAAVADVVVPVRLHSGNFDFSVAKPDGSDLRVVGPDDKTPLPFELERFDPLNELAVLWVRLPNVAQGSDKNLIHVYAGNDKAPAEPRAPVFANGFAAVLHFAETEGPVANAAGGAPSTGVPELREANGLLAGALRATGPVLSLPLPESFKLSAASSLSLSLWIKPDAPTETGTLAAIGPLVLRRTLDQLELRLDGRTLATGGALATSVWAHVALTVGAGKARIYVNGLPVGEADVLLPDAAEPLRLGEGFHGLIDELQLLPSVQSPAWVRLSAAAQGADGSLVHANKEASGSEGGGGEPGYFGVLLKNLTTDAWVVIIILMIMFVIAVWVMVTKSILVTKVGRANDLFLSHFRADLDGQAVRRAATESAASLKDSTLFQLYTAGQAEVDKRQARGVMTLSGAALDSIKATLDAVQVRQNQTLNSRIVLLTIAISGGPFLGLLGTVVGVMITFAAIAAAGDVNVNAIAPGIAAALLATVAGLGVAIPALFGYNWLAAQIKNISSDMQIFVDEFVTRSAETHGGN